MKQSKRLLTSTQCKRSIPVWLRLFI